ncbi:MAG TPA: alpha-1,4-glucan--maltose-1-phosphate maltosyltransferase, partial [Chloroflexota bacterium]
MGISGEPRRVVVEGVEPEIDCGRFAIKRTVGDSVAVEADVFADGHDELSAVLLHRKEGEQGWDEVPMEPLFNDRWRASFVVQELGTYHYTVEGWVDRFRSWRRDLAKKAAAGQDVSVELLEGAGLVESAAGRAGGTDASSLRAWASRLRNSALLAEARVAEAEGDELSRLMSAHPDRSGAARYRRELSVVVERPRARFSSWYEMFPRSASAEPGRHGTFCDVVDRLPYVASMGFDVLYFPPVHPIGRSFRKGKNNNPICEPGEPGSPWGIGSEEGGHKAVHPELGTLEDFRHLLAEAARYGIEIAIDIALQSSPDHPYVSEHPEWFRHRQDGTIQYAENPPKKYQDIYPLDFESARWRELWDEAKSILLFWIEQGVRVFRVDNPHTKPFDFWEWLIREIKGAYPEVIFLAEAFTRPKVMHRLAKVGFSQSYSYFAWRNTKWELTEYFNELTRGPAKDYFRPNLWPNTPDILTEFLQHGGRAAFISRLVLAATLGASYGIYGPAFEL